MNYNDNLLIVIGYNLIKLIIETYGFKKSYSLIFSKFFLAYSRNICDMFTCKSKKVSFLQSVSKKIFILGNEKEYIVQNCYSSALFCQLLAFINGIETKLVYGIKKEDETLKGHAWLIVFDKDREIIINPGETPLTDFQVIEVLNPKDFIIINLKNEILGRN